MAKTGQSPRDKGKAMNAGDMVRFREDNEATWHVGILIEYEKWYKIAKVLCRGEILSLHARHVQLHSRHPDNVETLIKMKKEESIK